MAGDKGAEILKPPPGVKQPPEGFYDQRGSTLKEAAKKALDSLRRAAGQNARLAKISLEKTPVGRLTGSKVGRETAKGLRQRDVFGDLTSEERSRVNQEFGEVRPGETYQEADKRFDEAVNRVRSQRNPQETKTTQSEE